MYWIHKNKTLLNDVLTIRFNFVNMFNFPQEQSKIKTKCNQNKNTNWILSRQNSKVHIHKAEKESKKHENICKEIKDKPEKQGVLASSPDGPGEQVGMSPWVLLVSIILSSKNKLISKYS